MASRKMTNILFTEQHLLPFDSGSKRKRLLQKDLLLGTFREDTKEAQI
jgi:hypothetical protein